MSKTLIDLLVVLAIFAIGMALTVRRFAYRNRMALAVVAILSPAVVIIALIQTIFLVFSLKRPSVEPCPEGLEMAERLVEQHRQILFGGPLREPSFTAYWKRAYELHLQKDTQKVQQIAERYLTAA
jgi:hypothetical protein